MHALSADEIRRSFVNSSKSQVKSITLPARLAETPWESLDYLGWRDPKAPARGYLVMPYADGVVGIALTTSASHRPRRGTGLCDLCLCTHPITGVALFAARRAGSAGRAGNTVGTYVCADLACSLYLRGLRELEVPQGDTIDQDTRIGRFTDRLETFVARVLA